MASRAIGTVMGEAHHAYMQALPTYGGTWFPWAFQRNKPTHHTGNPRNLADTVYNQTSVTMHRGHAEKHSRACIYERTMHPLPVFQLIHTMVCMLLGQPVFHFMQVAPCARIRSGPSFCSVLTKLQA